MKALVIGLIASILVNPAPADRTYSVWSEADTIHLIMSDNGTPYDFDDDWVVDWETNREFTVTILD